MNDSASQNGGTQVAQEEISRRAQELWEKYGRPSGRDEEIWYEAERMLKSQSSPPVQPSSGADQSVAAVTATTPPPRTRQSSGTAKAKIPPLRAPRIGGR